jgi:hypothetical protein
MASSSLKSVNPNAEIMSKEAALFMNINAAKGLQDVMKSNLGPKGTIKMLVGGAGGERKWRCRELNPGRWMYPCVDATSTYARHGGWSFLDRSPLIAPSAFFSTSHLSPIFG